MERVKKSLCGKGSNPFVRNLLLKHYLIQASHAQPTSIVATVIGTPARR